MESVMAASDKSENVIGSTAEKAAEVLSDLEGKSRALGAKAIERTADQASHAKAAVSQLAGDVADTLREGAEIQKNAGAEAVATLARSARDAAKDLQAGSPEVARLVRVSADAIERASMQLRKQSLSEIAGATGHFAARHPVAFFGCGLAAGFIVARLMTAQER
jgi:ElaB/YqjD/DUF883 family membrane-anchored ribosome-binding protein